MSDIKVSIVVPIHNLEKLVPRCLNALIKQTLQEIEIICVDDGSTDSAGRIIEAYKKKFPKKVKTFHKKNGGEWSARTFGLRHATGEYVGFIDSDDIPEPTWAEKLYKAAKSNDADIAFCGYNRVNLATGTVISTEMTQYGETNIDVDFNDDFIVYANPSLWNKLYRRELVKDLEFLPFRGCNDTLFLIHAYMYGAKKLTFIPDVLYHYYIRSGSQIHTMNARDIENLKKFLLVTKENAKKLGIYEEIQADLEAMVFLHLAISWAFMVSYNKDVKVSDITDGITDYLDKNFSGWRKNKFFKFKHCRKKGFKFICIWGVHLLYRIGFPGIYIFVNRLLVDKLKIEVKW